MTHPPPGEPVTNAPTAGKELYGRQVTNVIEKLGTRTPELLWILLLVALIVGGQLLDQQSRAVVIGNLVNGFFAQASITEANRQQSIMQLQETNLSICEGLVRLIETKRSEQ